MSDLRDDNPTDEEIVAAINELVEGVKLRWHPKIAGTVLANALGAITAVMDHKGSLRDCLVQYHAFVETGLQTLLDVVDNKGVG